MSDNSPFGAAEFLAFAAAWEFKATTSSPRYPQSNGKAENAIKTAKRLMTKASEGGVDPFLALLAWRNTPSAQLGQSPCQVLFSRRTRTLLPTAAALLTPPTAAAAQAALTAAKGRQAHYYDRRAKARPPLTVGQTVRARFDSRDWRKAEVARVLPHRSYELRFDDGTTRRRTSRHVHVSAEPPIIIKADGTDDENTTPPPISLSHSHPPHAAPGLTSVAQQPTPQQALEGEAQPDYRTRSGRPIRKPARYRSD